MLLKEITAAYSEKHKKNRLKWLLKQLLPFGFKELNHILKDQPIISRVEYLINADFLKILNTWTGLHQQAG